MLQDIH